MRKIIFLLFIIFLFINCDSYKVIYTSNIVVAGTLINSEKNMCYVYLWNNNIIEFIDDSCSYPTSVFYKDGKASICGYSSLEDCYADYFYSTFWQNGNKVLLSETNSYASDLFISENNTYITGYIDRRTWFSSDPDTLACYWKNNIYFALSDTYSMANSIYVKNGNIYIAGNKAYQEYQKFVYITSAIYWENDIEHFISTTRSDAITIFVDDINVYILVNERDNQYCWKNGTRIDLPNSFYGYKIQSIDNDVYIVGHETISNSDLTIPCYLKNFEIHYLPHSKSGNATSICSDKVGNIYISGVSDNQACYWFNDEQYLLGIENITDATFIYFKY